MNNVWTTIAFRAPCVARQSSRKPLLQLFNGYARLHTSTSVSRRAEQHGSSKRIGCSATWKHGYTTSAVLRMPRARPIGRRKDTLSEEPTSSSGLQPAPTVATHTEGLAEDAEALTWRDYDPAGGMPLPDGEKSQAQINGIFGNEALDAETGNYVLSVLYWRRMSGALIDSGVNFPRQSEVSREQALRGLEYVRVLDPGFDEQAAGQTWAEEESLRLQQELQERAINLKLYKRDDEPVMTAEDFEQFNQGTEYGRERNQDSALTGLREANKARNEAEAAKRIADQERSEAAALARHRGPLQLSGGVQPPTEVALTPSGGISISRPQTNAWLAPVERKPWVKYYENHAQIIKDNIVPQMSVLRRLGPSFLVLLTVLSACAYLSATYTPPPKSARLFPDTPPAIATLGGLTVLLAGFFLGGRIPPFWRTYSKYFTLVPAYPYAISLFGATFRHDTLIHLLTNIGSLWLFGLILHEDVGRGSFLAIYFASGAIGGFTSLAYNVLRKNWTSYIFGSSGCVLGVLSAACVLRPNGTIRIAGYDVPIAAWVFLGLYGTGEVVAVWRGLKTTIDHAGHLGGMVGGFGSAMWLLLQAREQRKGEEEPVMQSILADKDNPAEGGRES
ncbi:uncharacterized protein LTR77_009629 [Saxophila tyrrhenica]|uniref:Peptidase S54 rhomboid domain-containing protein n=1 Tax=Saxophila tyrrhenica TaxID=1690608 RepID=A0AAV9P0Y2_9PEZI|nr:hypothetical protein LTR77_009629 [Saxophila tyrrhenica]